MQIHQDDAIIRAAAALREARASRRPIAPISGSHGITGLDAAYAVAGLNVRARLDAGARIAGRKVGLTSPAVQRQLGVDQPDFGTLFADMEYLDGQEVPAARLLQPKIEAEVAFVLGADIDGERPGYAAFLRAVAFALPALEIVDSAIADWKIGLVDTVADNASCGLYVLGDQPVDVGRLSLADVRMQMRRGDEIVSEGSGAACLGHPLRAAYWLACTMAARGEPLRAGEVVLSGALGPMAPVAAGDAVTADLGALGRVTCRLV